jgi:NAD(P)-dependent dehydrogenase (short-subunit alcohol dehydrogenase family)
MTQQRNILLTGVSRGLGRAMTRRFAELGHSVLGCGRSAQAIEQLRDEFPAPHHFAVLDVADDDQVSQWADDLLASYDAPDLLLNNAALINDPAPLWNVSAEEFSQLIDVNIKGVFHVLRRFVPAMIERGSGIIVNFSSGWGRSTSPEVAPYCCSKWAIEGLTRAMADELPAGMAAVPLNPGVIDTDMLRRCFGANASGYPTADAWAERAVPFLLDLTPANNGQPLTV